MKNVSFCEKMKTNTFCNSWKLEIRYICNSVCWELGYSLYGCVLGADEMDQKHAGMQYIFVHIQSIFLPSAQKCSIEEYKIGSSHINFCLCVVAIN